MIGDDIGVTISNANRKRGIAAYRAVRLPEIVGLPPINVPDEDMPVGSSAASQILAFAAEELIDSNAGLAIRIVLRIGDSERNETLRRVLSRRHLSVLTVEEAERAAQLCCDVLRYALPRLSDNVRHSSGLTMEARAAVAMEVLSRLVTRVQPQLTEIALLVGLEFYGYPGIAQNWSLATPLENLFNRTWQALPTDRRSNLALDLLSAPMPGVGGFAAEPVRLDPAALVRRQDLRSNAEGGETKRRDVVEFLVGALNGGTATHRWTLPRLLTLVHSKTANDSDLSLIAGCSVARNGPSQVEQIGSARCL